MSGSDARAHEGWSPPPLDLPEVRPRLLMVDDEPLNIQAVYQAFAPDHQVLVATHGEQALALCASRQPDLVLLDVGMPGMDGFEVCRRLKADPSTRDIPVVFVTAHDDADVETRALAAGAVDFITKPIQPQVVRARVRTQLTLKRQADQLRQWVDTDGLTGVHNRRVFDARLHEEWGRARRQREALSVLLVDLDQFGRFNTRYGPQAGDDCLRRVAHTLAGGLMRHGDLLARLAADQFACLLPATPLPGAVQVARRLAEHLRLQAIAHPDSSVAGILTVSQGVAAASGVLALPADALLRAASEQMHQAKALGRNQICSTGLAAEPPGPPDTPLSTRGHP